MFLDDIAIYHVEYNATSDYQKHTEVVKSLTASHLLDINNKLTSTDTVVGCRKDFVSLVILSP